MEIDPATRLRLRPETRQILELLNLDKSAIHVASYWMEALPKTELERKLHEAVRLARARIENQAGGERATRTQ